MESNDFPKQRENCGIPRRGLPVPISRRLCDSGGVIPIRQATERLFPDRTVRRCLGGLTLLFFVAVPAGFLAPFGGGKRLAEMFGELYRADLDIAGGTLFLTALMNNVFASLLLLLSGMLAGVLPVLSVGFNGFVLGLVYRHVAETAGYGQATLDLLPPAVFEIPALLVSASYGLWLGIGFLRRIRKREAPTAGEQLNHAVERYFTLVFPLLIAAACIETFLLLRGR